MRKLCLVAAVLLTALPALGQQIAVLAPNGGEVWTLGCSQNIRWDHSGASGKVNILLFKDGARVGVIADNVAASAEAFTWIVGNYRGGTAVPGTRYKVRVKWVGAELSDDSNGPFEISAAAPPPPAATVSLTSPDGGESWALGERKTISWSYSGPGEFATLSLFRNGQDLGIIAASISAALGSYGWQVGQAGGTTVPAGPGHRVRIRIGRGIPADESGSSFTITAPVVPPEKPPAPAAGIVLAEVRIPPRLLSFAIDGGADRTEGRTVTLDHRVMGAPTHYRVQYERTKRTVRGDWLPYESAPSFAFASDTCGLQALGLQLKNEYGESGLLTDTIFQATKKDFRVSACEAKTWCRYPDWTFRVVESDCGDCAKLLDRCLRESYFTFDIRDPDPFTPLGSKAEFEIFGGRQLNEGWEFVSYEYTCEKWLPVAVGPLPPEDMRIQASQDYRIVHQPQPGSRDITLRVRVWREHGTYGTFFYVKFITLRGPCDRDVSEALR